MTEDEDVDRIRGVVHATGLARRLLEAGPRATIDPLVREAPIVPSQSPWTTCSPSSSASARSLRSSQTSTAASSGIVTVEDIVEEVVGEITDETDPAAGDVRQLPGGDWFVRGHVPVADLADYGIDLPADSEVYNSIGGLVFNDLGRLPKRGDKINVNGYELRVESVRENRIVLVRVRERHGHGTPRTREGEERTLTARAPGGVAGRGRCLGGGAVARYVSHRGVCGAPLNRS